MTNRSMRSALSVPAPSATSQSMKQLIKCYWLSGVCLPGKSIFRKRTTGVNSMPRPLDRLTDRELEVLDLIGRGHTTREIADRLQLGVATVDTYRARIKEKMNFRNATELQHFATRWVRERE